MIGRLDFGINEMLKFPTLCEGDLYRIDCMGMGIFIGECIETETLVSNPGSTFKVLVWLHDNIYPQKLYVLTAYEIQNRYYTVTPFPTDEIPLFIHSRGVLPYLEEYMRTKAF